MLIPYAAPISWYSAWLCSDKLPATPLNSCRIQCCGGEQTLSVPLLGGRKQTRNLPYMQLELSEHGNWRHLHWGALYSAFGRTPYFEYYQDCFHDIYTSRHQYLHELNLLMHNAVCTVMQIDPETAPKQLSEFPPELSRIGQPYHQVWKDKFGFLENLSILDLAFNLGPEAVFYLK